MPDIMKLIDEVTGISATEADCLHRKTVAEDAARREADSLKALEFSIAIAMQIHKRNAIALYMKNEKEMPREYEVRVSRIAVTTLLMNAAITALGFGFYKFLFHESLPLAVATVAVGCFTNFIGILSMWDGTFGEFFIKPVGVSEKIIKQCRERGFKTKIATNWKIVISW